MESSDPNAVPPPNPPVEPASSAPESLEAPPSAATSPLPAATGKLIVPGWALKARTIFRKGLIYSAAAAGCSFITVPIGFALGWEAWSFLFFIFPFMGILLFATLQVLILAAGFVQYSLGQMLKYTLIGAACVSAIVGNSHWAVTWAGTLGLIWIGIVFFRAASHADVRQK